MAGQEAKVNVRIDNSQALKDLAAIGKAGEGASGRIGMQVTAPDGGGGGGGKGGGGAAVGLGAALGVGVLGAAGFVKGAISAASEYGVAGEVKAYAESVIGATLKAPQGRGMKTTRDEARELYRASVQSGGDPKRAVEYFDARAPYNIAREQAANKIDREIGLRELEIFGTKAVKAIMDGMGEIKSVIENWMSGR